MPLESHDEYQLNVNRVTHLETALMAVFTLVFGAIYFIFKGINYCSYGDLFLSIVVLTPLIILYLHMFILSISFVQTVLNFEETLEGTSFSLAWARYRSRFRVSLRITHLIPLIGAGSAMLAFTIESNQFWIKIVAGLFIVFYLFLYLFFWLRPTQKAIKTFDNAKDSILTKIGIIYDNIGIYWTQYKDLLDLHCTHTLNFSPHSIADIGCGSGRLALKLVEKGIDYQKCIDNSKGMLEIFKRNMTNEGFTIEHTNKNRSKFTLKREKQLVEVVKGDASRLSARKMKFDVVNAMNSVYLFDNPKKGIRRAKKMLKPGGIFNISGPKYGADLRKIKKSIKEELNNDVLKNKIKDELGFNDDDIEEMIDQAIKINRLFLAGGTKYTIEEIRELLKNKKFDILLEESIYFDTGYFISARKPLL